LYTVTNDGTVALSDIEVVDSDAGLLVEAVDADNDGFNDGDINKDGLLDTDETWTYTAEGTAVDIPMDRQYWSYENTATATGKFDDMTVDDSDDSSYFVIQRGYVTDAALCRFGNDFQLKFKADEKSGHNVYTLAGTNPGQLNYNLFFDAAEADGGKVTLEIPYPFVLSADDPITAYAGVTVDGVDADTLAQYEPGLDPLCFTPGEEMVGELIHSIGGFDDQNGDGVLGFATDVNGDPVAETYEIEVMLPEGAEGFVYLNVQLDYGLVGTGPREEQVQQGWAADALGDGDVVDILDFTAHWFGSDIENSSDTMWNDNRFRSPDWSLGSEDDEVWHGHHGKDHYDAKGGDDIVYGRGGADGLWGGWGRDKVYGNGGQDFICAGKGNDRAWGGKGADTFMFRDGDGRDKVLDFDATGKVHDVIDLALVSEIKGWWDLKKNHLDEVDNGVWIRAEGVEVLLKGCDFNDLDKSDFLF
jgi:Ca2+-binding RTX toxin-like protein